MRHSARDCPARAQAREPANGGSHLLAPDALDAPASSFQLVPEDREESPTVVASPPPPSPVHLYRVVTPSPCSKLAAPTPATGGNTLTTVV